MPDSGSSLWGIKTQKTYLLLLPSSHPHPLPWGNIEGWHLFPGGDPPGPAPRWALSGTTHPDSSPRRCASWICKCRMCGSPPTTAHSPPGIVVPPKLALPAPLGPPGSMHSQRQETNSQNMKTVSSDNGTVVPGTTGHILL